MKNKHSNFKSIVQSKARWLFTLFALLTLGVGQMWAAYYVTGSTETVGSWNAAGKEMTQVGTTSTYYRTFTNFNENDTQIKVTNGTWDQSWGSGAIQSGADISLSAEDGNIKINGNPNKTITVWFNQENNKVWVTGTAYATQKVYFIGENSWTDSNVKAHVFLGEAAYYAWGSDQTMTKESTISRAGITYKVYSYTFPNGYKSIIFRYPSAQTSDLTWNASTPYYSIELSAWFASTADALAKYLVGTNWTSASWDHTDAANKMTDNGDGSYSKNISISDATKEIALKISKKGTWTGAWGGAAKGTGYNLSQDFGTDGDGNLTFKVTHSGTTKIILTSAGKINVGAPYQVSYAAGTGATGIVSASAITTYGSTCTLSSSTFSKSGYTQDGWATSDGGSKAYNLGATYTGGYTDVTLYPHWEENTYTVTYTATAGGSVTRPATSSSTVGQVTGVSIEATPSSGYHFDGWSITSGTGSITNPASASTTFFPTSTATIKASFAADAEETHNVTVSYKYGDTSIKDNTTESSVGVETSRSVTAPSITGYTFSSWTLGDGLTNKSANTTSNPISIVTKASGSFTLTANYTINSHNVIFNANGGTGSMSNESFNYNQTKALTTNTLTRTGYVFKGWATSAANATAGTFAYADGANYKMGDADVTLYAVWFKKVYFVNTPKWTAANVKAHVYTGETAYKTWNATEEVMTSTGTNVFGYTIFSYEFPETYTTIKFHNNGEYESAAQTWAAATPYFHYGANAQYASVTAIREAWKVFGSWNKTGDNWNSNDFATYGENSATYTVDLAAATSYQFQYVYDGNTDAWYGCTGGTMSDGDTWTLNGNQNVSFTTTVAGPYTFTITYSGMSSNNAPSCTLTFPTSYTVNFGVSPAGAASAPTNDQSISDGGLVLNGTSVTFTAAAASTGYTWSHWEKDGENVGTSNTYTTTIGAATTVTAVYTENSYSTNVAVSPAEKGSITSPTPAEGKINVSHHTGTSVTATPNTNYVFESWSVTDGGLAVKSPSTLTSNPATFTATSTGGTIQANFSDQWTVTGFGNNWSTYYGLPYKSANVYEGTVSLTAGNHSFKVVDRAGPTFYTEENKTITRANNTANAATTTGGSGNLTITADKAGDYTFNYNTSTHLLTVTYPVDPTFTVNVTAGAHGSITTPAGETVSAGEFTPADIVAKVDDYGYYFQGWTVERGSATIADASKLSTTVTATSAATIKANFVSHWTIAGGNSAEPDGDDAMGDWSDVINGIDHFSNIGTEESPVWQGYVNIVLPANTTFYFKVRDLYDGSAWYGNTGTMTYGNSTNWSMTKNTTNCSITTAGAGSYIFTWNETNETLTVTYPDSYTVTYGKVADNGQDIGGVTATGDDGATLESGKYVAKGSATFTAAEAENYTFVDWRTSNTYGGGEQLSTENHYTMNSIATEKTVYAHYAENMTSVTLAATNGKIQYWDGDSWEDTPSSKSVGVFTTCSIKAVPNTGYYFAGWINTEGSDYSITGAYESESNNNTTLSGLGAGEKTGQTLTANFVELDKIYFRNANETTGGKLWNVTKMYVYFGVDWGRSGAEEDGVTTAGSSQAEMNPVSAESNIFWAYVPRSFTTGENRKVAFSDEWMSSSAYPEGLYGEFYQKQAVYRTDYSKYLNMYVPEHTEKYTSNSTKYFDNGYWMKYNTVANQDAGYYLKEGNKDTQVDIFKATANNGTTLIAKYRFENTEDHTFFIANAAGKFYKVSATITNAACTNITLVEDAATPAGFTITPTAEGDYTLYIEQAGEKMKLSVVYPISAGDYRLDYTYNTNKHLYSDVIKPDNASLTNVKKSVYVDPATGVSLTLQKCTGLDAQSNPTWTATGVSVGTLSEVFTNGKGVYEFDMTITDGTGTSSDVASVSLSNVKLYTGNYYIKTDYAPGGWVNYKQNSLYKNTINFDKAKSSTFDYYFCKWVSDEQGGNRNVKCIIANDYNEQITDTLIGDDVLGKMEDNTTPRQYLAKNANVRFSYNSYTNELKRAYLNGSTAWEKNFLLLQGDEKIKSTAGTAFAGNSETFADQNNWIYQLDLKAQELARYQLTATYNNYTQYFIGTEGEFNDTNTEQLIGGADPYAEWFTLRLVYDFKTNHLVAGWLLGSNETALDDDKAIYSDVLVLRNHQNSAATLQLNGHSVTNVQTVYGVMEFDKSKILDGTKSQAQRALYWISFPFDVKASDIFGMGEYGKHWILEYYDGEARAREGQWVDSPTRWTFVDAAMRETFVLKKGQGYVLALDLDELGNSSVVWLNGATQAHIYFPSATPISTIVPTAETCTIPAHTCSITRNNRNIWDSNWNVIGVPAYWNIASFKTPATDQQPANADKILTPGAVGFYYKWDAATNGFSVETSESNEDFQTMYGYLVQYAGTINWHTKDLSSVAARRAATAEEKDKWTLDLHVAQDGTDADHTYIEFRDDVTDAYDMNNDLVKNANGNQTIVYTLLERAYMPDPTATTPVRMGANCLQVPAADKTIAVGLIANKAGEYTFSMPEGTDGMDVTLIDYELNRETNLSLGDYTAVLEKGTCDARFALRINRKNTVTSLEGCNGSELRTAEAEKVMINGNLYIRQNGQSFDAQGKRVE